MLASSPSPSSAALRSGSAHPHYESAPQFSSPRSSRLAIEELRSALNRHTVDPASPDSPAVLQRRRASASVDLSAPIAALASSSQSRRGQPSTATLPTATPSGPVIPPPTPSVRVPAPDIRGAPTSATARVTTTHPMRLRRAHPVVRMWRCHRPNVCAPLRPVSRSCRHNRTG